MKNLKIIGIVLSLLFFGCKKEKYEGDYIRNVIITTPQPDDDTSVEYFSGVIEEGKSVKASFMADGKINKLMVKEGDRVKKGQLLANLDDSDYQIGVNQLRAQLNQMTEEKRRMDEMFNRHNISPNDYEKFSAGYEQLKLQMEMAENKLGYTKLYSPTDGYVSEKYMEPGELVGAGTPIYKITDDTKLTANIDLPVNIFINRKNIANTYGFSPVFPDTSIPLTVESFTPDPSNNMLYQMKLLIPSKYSTALTPGMNIKVEVAMNESGKSGYKVPSRSVFEENGTNYIWVYNNADSTIHKKLITITSQPVDKYINITGVEGNELIVETGVKQLYEGEKVHVSKNSDYGL